MPLMQTQIFHNLFSLGMISIAEKIVRPILVYVFLIVGLRLAGKRELAQLNPFDLVVLLTLSNAVQNAIIGEDNSVTGGIIGAASLLVTNYLVVRFLYDHRKLERFIEGNADVLIDNGRLQDRALKHELITLPQLEAAARKQGFETLDEVQRCVLEPGGTLTFRGKQPTTDESRHEQLLQHLQQLREEVSRLRATQPPAQA